VGDGKSPGALANQDAFPQSAAICHKQPFAVSWVHGGMLVRTGSHGSCVGRKVPEISRMELFSCASTKSAWADLNQTGQQYSAAE